MKYFYYSIRHFNFLAVIVSLLLGNVYGQAISTSYISDTKKAPWQDNWIIGINTGITTYHGDLSYKHYLSNRNDILSLKHFNSFDSRTIGICIEKQLFRRNRKVGLSFNAVYGNVTGNDRTRNFNGNLVTDNPNFARSLNFRTEFYDANLSLTYSFLKNGYIKRNHGRLYPYISAGIGITCFYVYGDLYTVDGGRYYYWTDGSIKNMAQNHPNASDAVEVKQDREYETRTTSWKTEGKDYNTISLNIPVSLGLKYRLSYRFDIVFQATTRFLFTDYFDDVSGAKYNDNYSDPQHAYIANPNAAHWNMSEHEYRGNPNGRNDRYNTFTVGINYHFGQMQWKRKPKKEQVDVIEPIVIEEVDSIMISLPAPKIIEEEEPPLPTSFQRIAALEEQVRKLQAQMDQQQKNNPQLEEMTRTLTQMNKTLELMAARLNNLESKPTSPPVVVNPPSQTPIVEKNNALTRATVFFGNNSSTINPNDYEKLNSIVQELTIDKGLMCSIIGYASVIGNPEHNKILSEKRAENVSKYLILKGIDTARIMTESMGSTQSSNNNNLDRRVEIKIIAH